VVQVSGGALTREQSSVSPYNKSNQDFLGTIGSTQLFQQGLALLFFAKILTNREQRLERFRAKHALVLDTWVDTGSREENASNQKARAHL
jgi:hypothetical protein